MNRVWKRAFALLLLALAQACSTSEATARPGFRFPGHRTTITGGGLITPAASPLRLGFNLPEAAWYVYNPPLVDGALSYPGLLAGEFGGFTGTTSSSAIPDANRDASGNVKSLPGGEASVNFILQLPPTLAQRQLTWDSSAGGAAHGTNSITIGNATGVTVDTTNRIVTYTPVDVLGTAASNPSYIHYTPVSTSDYPVNFRDRPVVDSGAVISPQFAAVVAADTSPTKTIRFMKYTSVERNNSPRHLTADPGKTISSITFSGTTATVTTATAHGLLGNGTGSGSASVTVTGATPSTYNVTDAYVNVVDATHFRYTMAGTPAGNASVVGSYTVGDVNYQFTNLHFPNAGTEPGTQFNEPIYTSTNRNKNKADAEWHDGASVETLAAIAAGVHANAWYTAPPNADATFYADVGAVWASFAATNNLDVYLEVGNEPWNDGYTWSHQLSAEASISGILKEQRYAQKVVEVANYFRTAFTSAGALSHLHVVAAWQSDGPTSVWSSMSTFLGTTDWAKITDLSVAGYYGDNSQMGIATSYTGSTATLKAAISSNIDYTVGRAAAHQVAAQALGKRLILYEGGSTVVLDDKPYKSAFERSTDAYDLEAKFLQQLELKVAANQTGGLDLASYNLTYPLGANSFSWGQVEYLSQTLSKATTPKLWAHVDFTAGTRILADATGLIGPAPLAATVGTSLGFLNPSAYNVSWSLTDNDSGRLSIIAGTGEVKVAASLAPSGVHSFTARQTLGAATKDTVVNYTVGGTTWNNSSGSPASNAAYAISGGGTIATRASGSGDADVIASNGHSTGTYSFTVTPTRTSGIYFVGLVNASESNTNFIGATGNSIGLFQTDGKVYRGGGVVLASGATLTDSSPVTVLIDAGKVYFKVSGADIPGMNYAARTGGIDISGMGTLYPAADASGVCVFTLDATNWP